MFTNIAITPMFVTDQDQALEFYTRVLGFEVHTDADLGPMRWLTVNLPGQSHREVLLQQPGPPAFDQQTADLAIELTERGAATWMILQTEDVHAVHQRLVAAGAEVTQEPAEQPYGVDMAIRDPFGNQIRITQPTPAD